MKKFTLIVELCGKIVHIPNQEAKDMPDAIELIKDWFVDLGTDDWSIKKIIEQ